jgi:hypothetical protein
VESQDSDDCIKIERIDINSRPVNKNEFDTTVENIQSDERTQVNRNKAVSMNFVPINRAMIDSKV